MLLQIAHFMKTCERKVRLIEVALVIRRVSLRYLRFYKWRTTCGLHWWWMMVENCCNWRLLQLLVRFNTSYQTTLSQFTIVVSNSIPILSLQLPSWCPAHLCSHRSKHDQSFLPSMSTTQLANSKCEITISQGCFGPVDNDGRVGWMWGAYQISMLPANITAVVKSTSNPWTSAHPTSKAMRTLCK